MATETYQEIVFPCIKVSQPIGEFFIASISSKTLCQITHFDVRRILREEREIERYLGIQRPLDPKRVEVISHYVNTADACFPTAVILAVPGLCAKYDPGTSTMTLSNYVEPEEGEEPIYFGDIAKVLDGQHRIEGLRKFGGEAFDVNVSLFVDADIADQAYIFSTVNLAQTKVQKSLVYDLYDLAKARSPQKTSHNIVVALDQNVESPFYKRIKRLGMATEGRVLETITQATFVQSLLTYMCKNQLQQQDDRDKYLRGKEPSRATEEESYQLIFRNMFLDNRDIEIAEIIYNFFVSVRDRWPTAWDYKGGGIILNKTNGFRAMMRFLRIAYLHLTKPGGVPSTAEFLKILNRVTLSDLDFNTDSFKPGTSGEAELYRVMLKESKLR